MTRLSDFGMRVRILRVRNRMGVRELAKILRTSAGTVSRLENGKPVEVKLLDRACLWVGANIARVLQLQSAKLP